MKRWHADLPVPEVSIEETPSFQPFQNKSLEGSKQVLRVLNHSRSERRCHTITGSIRNRRSSMSTERSCIPRTTMQVPICLTNVTGLVAIGALSGRIRILISSSTSSTTATAAPTL